ncbi:NEL-type E3 ubiquitin ligase domain-containing protein [uncultured Providencia sp.]|uniref:NEL-type E3 ubiquitin ligase domain-containing protein n=1 Tax=uncultured Providencia sp. TaxID=390517 RepID=UPI002805C1BC|nr:NEL-type E3 ubiquitin ligase domain-containing protein [uncultured Providencia sp.]WMP40919.1 bacterial effector [uncultured bacterium]
MFRAINCFSTRNISTSQENLSTSAAIPSSAKELKSLWKTWSHSGEPGENRKIAYERLKDCMKRQARELDLNSLGLTSLPSMLPACVDSLNLANNNLATLPLAILAQRNLVELNISSNQITEITELPSSIIFLGLSHNRLTTLPELPRELEMLYINNNELTILPPLPETLTILDISNNQLSELPELPRDNIRDVNARNNNISNIPNSVLHLTSAAQINLRHNPLTDQAVLNIVSASANSPRIIINPERIIGLLFQGLIASENQQQNQPLAETIAKWYSEEERSNIITTWKNFANEENSQAFADFMNRLHKSTQSNELKPSVLLLLSKLVESSPLRATIFAVTFDATTSCDDRVSLTWNNIQKAVAVHEAESGSYDQHLPQLIQMAKELYCLEELEVIANQKVKELVNPDDIEVYLAYQNGLAKSLNLSTAQGNMLFGRLSGVTQEDLTSAEQTVKNQLKIEFIPWFNCWGPWHAVMSRIASEPFEQAKEQLYEFIEKDYSEQVQNKLSEDALNDIPDAESLVGKIVLKEMEQKIFGRLTQEVLSKHNIDLSKMLLIN